MSAQPERADLGGDAPVVDNPSVETDWTIPGIDRKLTPLQYHYLTMLRRMVAIKDDYQIDPDYEASMMAALNKAIYSTLRDSIEANVGDEAKKLLNREQHVS